MAGGYPQPIFLDATVISNHASTNSIGFLVSILESPVVVPAVRDEIERGLRFGHDYLATAVEAFDDGLQIGDVSSETAAGQLRDRLDPGEADALRGAVERDGTLATDDLAARRLADELGIPVTGSIGLLVVGIEHGASTEKRQTNGSSHGASSADTTCPSRVSVNSWTRRSVRRPTSDREP